MKEIIKKFIINLFYEDLLRIKIQLNDEIGAGCAHKIDSAGHLLELIYKEINKT